MVEAPHQVSPELSCSVMDTDPPRLDLIKTMHFGESEIK
jgi:hypothetical protein